MEHLPEYVQAQPDDWKPEQSDPSLMIAAGGLEALSLCPRPPAPIDVPAGTPTTPYAPR